jgi:hypothetical protein
MSIYEKETKNEVNLYISDYYNDNIYRGNFYKFIVDIFSVLQLLLPRVLKINEVAAAAYEILPLYCEIPSFNYLKNI